MFEASITLIPKLDKDITKHENYRPLFCRNIGTKVLERISKSDQQYVERLLCASWPNWGYPRNPLLVSYSKIKVLQSINKIKVMILVDAEKAIVKKPS